MDAVARNARLAPSVRFPRMQEADYELARRLHRSLLPSRLTNDYADVVAVCREFDVFGGDYCTAYWQSPEKLFLCVCDVTGHGLAAALLAARINTFVRLEVERARHPCEIVEHLNRFLCKHFSGFSIFSTFFCAEIDFAEGAVRFAGAGHPPALLRSAGDGKIHWLESRVPLLGVVESFPKSCTVDSAPFHSDDVLLLYTDGLIESRNPSGEFFEIHGIEACLQSIPKVSDAKEVVSAVLQRLDYFAPGGGVNDDILLLCAVGKDAGAAGR